VAVAIYSFKRDEDGRLRVLHVFFGETQKEAWANHLAHAEICPAYGPAVKYFETTDFEVEIDHIPDPDDEEDLSEFVPGEEE
jgi:hypothetical protein